MPELPEVETVMRGLKPQLEGINIVDIVIRQGRLRWPIPHNLATSIENQTVHSLTRRGKYLLINLQNAQLPAACPRDPSTLIIHLGMSGSLRIVNKNLAPKKHDHVDIILNNACILRYNDPRRFGSILYTDKDPNKHPLLIKLGPEPLENDFNAAYLAKAVQNRRKSIKEAIMDSHLVVGVGNIYAAEALFLAQIHPQRTAGSLTLSECEQLVNTIKSVLSAAILQGGSTIKDFINAEGKPGYFAQKLQVYGRDGLHCHSCQTILVAIKQGQRSTVYCPICQH